MKPNKQTVYLPVEGKQREFYLSDSTVTGVAKNEGYFFTPSQLNEYIKTVIKQALKTAAKKADAYIDAHEDAHVEGNVWSVIDKKSITSTFEETFKRFEV